MPHMVQDNLYIHINLGWKNFDVSYPLKALVEMSQFDIQWMPSKCLLNVKDTCKDAC